MNPRGFGLGDGNFLSYHCPTENIMPLQADALPNRALLLTTISPLKRMLLIHSLIIYGAKMAGGGKEVNIEPNYLQI